MFVENGGRRLEQDQVASLNGSDLFDFVTSTTPVGQRE